MPTEKRQRQKEGQRARREAALAAARRRQRKRQVITFAVITVLVFGGIFLLTRGGGSKKQNASTTGSSTTTSSTAPTSTTAKSTTPTSAKPTITVPKDPAPTELKSEDLKVGDGPEAKPGDTVDMNYVGVTYSDGKQFDASWDRGQTFSFKIGEGKVIKGWDQGVPGMKVGGRRQLTIPASLAYGDPAPSGYPSGTLIFIVDLVSIH